MDEATIAHDELDHFFISDVEATSAAHTAAQERLDNWRNAGVSSRSDVIGAWKRAAAVALSVARAGHDPQPQIERVEAMRRWVIEQGFWSPDEDLPVEVEIALRGAVRAARA